MPDLEEIGMADFQVTKLVDALIAKHLLKTQKKKPKAKASSGKSGH